MSSGFKFDNVVCWFVDPGIISLSVAFRAYLKDVISHLNKTYHRLAESEVRHGVAKVALIKLRFSWQVLLVALGGE